MLNVSGYKIIERINEGKSSVVYRGIDESNRKCILKVIKSDKADLEQINKIINEYETVKNINSNGVIKTYGLKQIQGNTILILEDFNALSLKSFLKNSSIIDVQTFLKIAVKIASSLEEIHRHNIIHGDIKPDNILINPENLQIKLTDFGFSFNSDSKNNKKFIDNLEKENLKYISPEQTGRMNQEIDIRTDFYSMGIVFYEMLMGSTPFNSDDVMEIIHQHIAKKPFSPNEINSLIPKSVSEIIMKLLEKNVNERYKSDYGIIYDLKLCLEKITNKQPIDDFIPGRFDISQEFNISQKTYGKNFALKNVLSILDNFRLDKPNIVFINGKAGIGKTYFLNYLSTNFIKRKNNLVFIRFDKTKKTNPYYCFIQALSQFTNELIIQNKTELNIIKEKITDELADNIYLLTEKIPELAILFDDKKFMGNINYKDSQINFNVALKKFLKIFSLKDKPLTICVDDLNYADPATSNLIKDLLSDEQFKYLNLILINKDDEENQNVSVFYKDSDDLRQKVIEMANTLNISVNQINLQAFDLNEIIMLISDTFGYDINETEKIAKVIFSKTQGNPFFINEFIKNLYDKKIIYFKPGFGWVWNIEDVSKMEMTKNVIDLMVEKINYLPDDTIDVLKAASCIGVSFDSKFLAKIYDERLKKINLELNNALNNGILILSHEKNNYSKNNTYKSINKFSHDKIHETIYSLIDSKSKSNFHYKIGKEIYQEDKDKIYEISNHLNLAIDVIKEKNEEMELAKLNLTASIKAKESSAYTLALDYIKKSVNLIDQNLWNKDYETAFEIYLEYARIEYFNLNFKESEEILDELFKKAINNSDKARICELKSIIYITVNKVKEAINTGILGLKFLNFDIPLNPININSQLAIEFFRTRRLLKKIDLKEIPNLPKLQDEKLIMIMNIMIVVVTAAYMCNTSLMFLIVHKMINISLKNGNSSVSAYAYSAYASFYSYTLNDPKKGYDLGRASIQLLEKYQNPSIKTKVNFIFSNLVHDWSKHDREDIKIMSGNIKTGIESGDLLYAGYSVLHLIVKMFIYGDNLDLIYNVAKNNSNLMIQTRDSNVLEEFLLRTQLILSLKGLTYSNNTLSDNNFNEEKFFYIIKKSGNISTLAQAYIVKMQMNYFFENYESALEYAEEAKKYLLGCYANNMIPEFYFFYSLTLSSLCIKKPHIYKKRKYISIIKSNQKKMRKWAEGCHESFLHRYILIEAELAFINQKYSKASEYYNESIELSGKYGFTHYQALANELSGKFYLSRGHELIAKEYINEAHLCYNKWGAKGKTVELEKKYPFIFNQNKESEDILDFKHNLINKNDLKLDLETVIKASQTLSGEIFLDKLIDKLMKIVVENAGAQRGVLILKNKDELFIEAEGDINYEKTIFFPNKRMDLSDNVSHSIINYVERTGNDVVIDDAITDGVFTSDYYIISKKPKSILCIPINKQQYLIGILYLENNLTKSAFTSDRIQVLKLIASQAAISLENARLYDEMRELNISLEQNKNSLEDMVDKRSKQLRLTQKKLVDAAHRSGMAEIATGVLHNIGNILNGVNISSQLITERIENSKVEGLIKANSLLEQNRNNLAEFLINDPKGKKLVQYYLSLGDILKKEIDDIAKENQSLSGKITLMKEVIATQQNYAKVGFLNEKVNPVTIIEDAISIQMVSLIKNNIRIIKNYNTESEISIQKSKIINILINLLKNSEEALENNTEEKIIKIELGQYQNKSVFIKISDNGQGIPEENINKIFNHGFTTKITGHGFGLHTSANAMTEMGGKIFVKSDGLNKGATFKLVFPVSE